MRIAILTAGSRGDVQPYVALGAALKRAGHAVRVSAYASFQPLVAEQGMEFAPSSALNPQDFINRPDLRAAQKSGNQLGMLVKILQAARPLLDEVLNSYWAASQGSDALIFSAIYHGAYDCAKKLGIPGIFTMLTPVFSTRALPNPFFGPQPRLGGGYNRLTHWLFDQLVWQIFRGAVNHWRLATLGLPPHPFLGPRQKIRAERPLTLCGFSPHVAAPPDWPPEFHLTGYWFLDDPPGWQPSPDLLNFLEAGPPPVYIGFGSMSDANPERLTRLALEALALSGQRGILLSGWGGLKSADVPGSIFTLDSIPHSWLFPRVAAVVHHGGAGTTGAGLRAGRPAVVLPFVADQFFWGRRVAELGAGPAPIPASHLTARRLAAAITTAVSDNAIRARAAALGEKIRAEAGAGRAAEVVSRALR